MKKVWNTPAVTVHGSVEAITAKSMAKRLGAGDDLATIIETNSNHGDKGVLS